MRLSEYFLPTLKETPAEAQIVSHRYMLRAGMVRQACAGIYSWLPMGLTVMRKIEQIVREEQNRAGCQEVLMPTIQSADLWKQSGRYDDYGKEMLRILDRHDREMLYGPTNEELITDIFRHAIKSYRGLPKLLYHIQWKFRDEVRPRFGIMRGREFLMKDGYSFDIRCRGGAGFLLQDVRSLSQNLLPAWVSKPFPWKRTPGPSAAISATNSSSWRTPERVPSTATKICSITTCLPKRRTTTAI